MHRIKLGSFQKLQSISFRWRAFGLLLFQFAYIVSWSIFGVVKDWTERHKYVLPSEGWRIAIFVSLFFLIPKTI